jgi:Flp pilus assembly protein TadD
VQLKRPAEAVRQFRRAVELLPGKVEPYHWLGRTLIGIGQAEEGRKALDEVKRLKAAEHEHLPDLRTRPTGGTGPGNTQ